MAIKNIVLIIVLSMSIIISIVLIIMMVKWLMSIDDRSSNTKRDEDDFLE